ncbi:hypothetical protein BX616_005472 [Lobosporangium transversale]|uniref:Uncharacterized protein n=1 Tax=Lobosporangium transversale TaxID=64571 RepID=A0A1Y2G6Q3_9FUNG|nr:hypothetical protein BCR41DRAFT_401883 [Lobosporangium transversale]KAF9915746.1 hypothetical protein BX616_005472 [Lobosporangium transversale]ORY98389.1 hypothetical protein BCR41DRAFT_401883 [Lobosporangium transversale]|eukprot:XP_021875781.1 hypothetical protein BCR41DRAFT_401883 [Lobosporangium transversale]
MTDALSIPVNKKGWVRKTGIPASEYIKHMPELICAFIDCLDDVPSLNACMLVNRQWMEWVLSRKFSFDGFRKMAIKNHNSRTSPVDIYVLNTTVLKFPTLDPDRIHKFMFPSTISQPSPKGGLARSHSIYHSQDFDYTSSDVIGNIYLRTKSDGLQVVPCPCEAVSDSEDEDNSMDWIPEGGAVHSRQFSGGQNQRVKPSRKWHVSLETYYHKGAAFNRMIKAYQEYMASREGDQCQMLSFSSTSRTVWNPTTYEELTWTITPTPMDRSDPEDLEQEVNPYYTENSN